MYASLSAHHASASLLVEVASRFSPEVELSAQTVTFSIAPLRQLIGSPHQIASEICRAGYECKLQASLAIAANPDSAILLARHFRGVTMVTPGEERLKLASLPLAELFAYDAVKLAPNLLDILLRWGIKTCEDLAALPEKGLSERLGAAGLYLRQLACGTVSRPLRLKAEQTSYTIEKELEDSLELLEPLLFLLSRAAGELCHRLRAQSQAARQLELQLLLNEKPLFVRLEFPVPLSDPRTILKLLQLHLERHPPVAPVRGFRLHLEPVEPQRVQGGIFLPPTPAPDKLHVTLARIAGMVGAENVGTPVLLNTHRPDAFALTPLPSARAGNQPVPEMLRLAMRLFRPALQAQVQLVHLAPKNIAASGIRGRVLRHAGPWKTSGDWWTTASWTREEWDVALDDGALYRIYQESATHEWFVHAVYD